MTSNIIEAAKKILPEGAFDIEMATPFVARYKEPNSYSKDGYRHSIRFLAYEAAKAVAEALGDDWEAVETESDWCGTLISNHMQIRLAIQGYGTNAYKRINISGSGAAGRGGKAVVKSAGEITVTARKTAAQIANDIRKRLLDDVAKAATEAAKQVKAEAAALGNLEDMANALSKRYGDSMNFRVQDGRVAVECKVGGNIWFRNAEVLKRHDGSWGFSCNGLTVDDIQSKSGRAFMRALCE